MNKYFICNKIKSLRIGHSGKDRGAQKRFSEFLEIKYTTYRNCEQDRVNIDVLIALRKKLDVSLDDIFSEEVGRGYNQDVLDSHKNVNDPPSQYLVEAYSEEEKELVNEYRVASNVGRETSRMVLKMNPRKGSAPANHKKNATSG